MNAVLVGRKPMALPDDRRELTHALADLLLNAVFERAGPEPEEQA